MSKLKSVKNKTINANKPPGYLEQETQTIWKSDTKMLFFYL